MKINRPSYKSWVSDDEKLLFNVGGMVSILDISGEKFVELKRFTKLKHPSYLALSSNKKLLACSNTSGHIAVYDIETGETLIKSKYLSEEGRDLFFINNDTQIISPVRSGQVFIFDIESGKTTVAFNFPLRTMNICPVSDSKFVAFGSNSGSKTYSRIFEFFLTGKATEKDLKIPYPYSLESSCIVFSDECILFCGSNDSNNNKMKIIKFNLSKSETEWVFDTKTSIVSLGYFTCMCISKNK